VRRDTGTSIGFVYRDINYQFSSFDAQCVSGALTPLETGDL